MDGVAKSESKEMNSSSGISDFEKTSVICLRHASSDYVYNVLKRVVVR